MFHFQHCAVTSPYPKRKAIVESLIRKGAHLNEKNKELLAPIHLAADLGHLDVLDTLLRLGAKVNLVDVLGQTALHRTARDDKTQAVRVLLSHNADTSIVSLLGNDNRFILLFTFTFTIIFSCSTKYMLYFSGTCCKESLYASLVSLESSARAL